MSQIKKLHKQHCVKIKSRLNDFKNLTESEQFKEFQFCLLTPQSNAQRCWSAVEKLSKLNNPSLNQITKILATKTRFHNVKAKRILKAKETFQKILPQIRKGRRAPAQIPEIRNYLAKEVNGYGLKEAAHFLRNIGLSNNKIAILDRHILKNLGVEKITSQKHYLEIEQDFMTHARSLNIPLDELDLLWWSQENGEIFK